jgi:hypothetical protein
MDADRQAQREEKDMAQRATRVEAHRGNRAALAAWGTDDDMDPMDR